jgi:hypothetical protein
MPNQTETFPNLFVFCRNAQTVEKMEKIWGNNHNHTKPLKDLIPNRRNHFAMKEQVRGGLTRNATPNAIFPTIRREDSTQNKIPSHIHSVISAMTKHFNFCKREMKNYSTLFMIQFESIVFALS